MAKTTGLIFSLFNLLHLEVCLFTNSAAAATLVLWLYQSLSLLLPLKGDDLQCVHLGSLHGFSLRLSDYTADGGTSQAIPC